MASKKSAKDAAINSNNLARGGPHMRGGSH